MFKIGDRIRSYDFEDRSQDSYWVGVIKEDGPGVWICTTVSRMLNGVAQEKLPETFGAPKPRVINGVALNFVDLVESAPDPVEVVTLAKKAKKAKA